MSIQLLTIWSNVLGLNHCDSYYCTTCGGMHSVAQPLLSSMSKKEIVESLLDPRFLLFKPRDFKQLEYQSGWYPQRKNISVKVEYFVHAFRTLDGNNQAQLIKHWKKSYVHWPLWLLDGLSYYVISESKSSFLWLKVLESEVSRTGNSSLIETKRIKFNN